MVTCSIELVHYCCREGSLECRIAYQTNILSVHQVSVLPCPGARAEIIVISLPALSGIARCDRTEVIFIVLNRFLV